MVKVDSPNDTNLKVRPIEKTSVKGALNDWDSNDLTMSPVASSPTCACCSAPTVQGRAGA